LQATNTDALFIAVSAVSERVAWAAGTGGQIARTDDGGSTWEVKVVPGADSLQFRDVHGIDANSAYILSIGSGSDSRIYRTDDAGGSWRLLFQNDEPEAFFDCMDFWDEESGIAFSDAVDSEFVIITTGDGGESWSRVDPMSVPDALGSEGSFAASGTCVTTFGDSTAWIGTAAGDRPRVLKTTDRGRSWVVAETPVVGGQSAGIATITFRDALNGFVAGGDINAPTEYRDNVAVSHDGGLTWSLAARPLMPGAIFGSTYVPGAPTPTIVVTGPAGVNYSVDNGLSWQPADSLNYWGVDFAGREGGWTVGTDGKIAFRYFRSRP
jgi:photosystem II stability/assembly factor-like uncharacterized protein